MERFIDVSDSRRAVMDELGRSHHLIDRLATAGDDHVQRVIIEESEIQMQGIDHTESG